MNWLKRIFAAQAEIGRLKMENAGLRDRNADLVGQIDWHSKAITISPENLEALKTQRDQFDAMKYEQDEIAKFLRIAYANEIAAGAHNGRSISDVVNFYLGELKELRKKASA